MGPHYLNDDLRAELESGFAQFVGPLAGRLIAMYEPDCLNLAQLVNALADEIPDREDRDDFTAQWQHLMR